MNEKAPVAVSAIGGKYILDDDRTIPDTMEVIFEFKSGSIIKFSIYEGTSGTGITGGEVELNGTKATLVANENGYEIKPARPGQFQNWKKQADPEKYEAEKNPAPQNSGFREDSTSRLIRNFLNCVKSKEQPWCPLEEGHRSTSFAHLANIALAVGQRLTWDADAEKFINSEKANQLLHYEYRKPWKLI
jgi:predicted dehydrogenase